MGGVPHLSEVVAELLTSDERLGAVPCLSLAMPFGTTSHERITLPRHLSAQALGVGVAHVPQAQISGLRAASLLCSEDG